MPSGRRRRSIKIGGGGDPVTRPWQSVCALLIAPVRRRRRRRLADCYADCGPPRRGAGTALGPRRGGVGPLEPCRSRLPPPAATISRQIDLPDHGPGAANGAGRRRRHRSDGVEIMARRSNSIRTRNVSGFSLSLVQRELASRQAVCGTEVMRCCRNPATPNPRLQDSVPCTFASLIPSGALSSFAAGFVALKSNSQTAHTIPCTAAPRQLAQRASCVPGVPALARRYAPRCVRRD